MTVAAPLRLPLRLLPAAVARPVDLPPMLYLDPEVARDAGFTMGQIVRVQIAGEERLVRVGPMLTSLTDQRAAFLSAALYTEAGEATIEPLADAPTLSRVAFTPAGDVSHAATREAVARLAERGLILHVRDLIDLGSAGNVRVVACSPSAGLLHPETEVQIGEQSPQDAGATEAKEVDRAERMVTELELAHKADTAELQKAGASLQRLVEANAALEGECNSLAAELAEAERSMAQDLARRSEERDRLTDEVDDLRQEVDRLRQRSELGPDPSERKWKAP